MKNKGSKNSGSATKGSRVDWCMDVLWEGVLLKVSGSATEKTMPSSSGLLPQKHSSLSATKGMRVGAIEEGSMMIARKEVREC